MTTPTFCEAQAAEITLIEEALLTRTAVTPATAGRYGSTTSLDPGDPRLGRLNAILAGTTLSVGGPAGVDARMVLRLRCDGGDQVVAASASEGAILHLLIDGQPADAPIALRRQVAALVGFES